MIDVLNSLKIEEIAGESVTDNAELIADLNADQLAHGIRADGSQTLPAYKSLTIAIKKTKSGLAAITDRVTLFDTGDFYRNLYAEVQGEFIEYGSRDEKAPKLEKKYSDKRGKGSIFGLTEDSKDELITGGLGESWQKKITEKTGLTFK